MNQNKNNNFTYQNSITRLERISDMIFALAMAQCFFAVDFPVKFHHPTDSQTIKFLISQIKPLTSYAFAFVIVGFYWIDNINQFKHYKRTDTVHSSVYLLYLMGMFLIPYSDTLVIYFPNSAIVKICFSINTAFIGLMSFINWNYAIQKSRLVTEDISCIDISETRRKILIEPVLSLLTIGVAIIDQSWWEFVWFLLPIPYLWSDIYGFFKRVLSTVLLNLGKKKSKEEYLFSEISLYFPQGLNVTQKKFSLRFNLIAGIYNYELLKSQN